jgi:4-amino-4-deoxy-L-arabinose transferase-like glycosyltransferase
MARGQGWRTDAALVLVLLLIATGTGLLWLYSVPFHKAPDEGAHYQVVRFIRDYGRLPVFEPSELWLIRTPTGVIETYAAFPPLAYIASAMAGWVLHDESMWAARYVSLVCYLGTVAVTFWIGRQLVPQARSVAVYSALAVAFLPQFAFTGGYVNNDALAVAETAVLLALLMSAWKSGARPWTLLSIGILAGALATTKYTFYGVAGIGLATAALLAWAQRDRYSAWRGLVAMGSGAAAMSLWWFARNVQLYGQMIPGRVISEAKASAGGNALFIPADHGINLLNLSTQTNFWELTLKSFFGAFGFMAIFLDAPYYWAGVGLVLVGAVGVGMRIWRRGIDPSHRMLVLVALAIGIATVVTTMVVNVYGEYSPQGRYLFPMLVPLALAVAGGWCWLAREVRLMRWVPAAATLLLVGLNLSSLFFYVIPRNYGIQSEHVTVQVDRPAGPHPGGEPIVIAGWSMSEGMSRWRPYDPDVIGDYRHPVPGISIYMGGPPGQGTLVAEARYGFRRRDVADFYGGASDLERIGFWFELPAGSLEPGMYQLFACASTPSQSASACGERDLEVL